MTDTPRAPEASVWADAALVVAATPDRRETA